MDASKPVVPDTREAWGEMLDRLLDRLLSSEVDVSPDRVPLDCAYYVDYSNIRPTGKPIPPIGTYGKLSLDLQPRWDVIGRAMDSMEANFAEKDAEPRHACHCPLENFMFNGVGCKCGGV